MSIKIPSTFYGAGCAVCAMLFFGAFMGDVADIFRITGIVIGILLFLVITGVYVWDRGEYYQHAGRS